MPLGTPHPRPTGVAGRTLALAGTAALLFASLGVWTRDGRAALDMAALDPTRPGQPSVALVLVALAALPALAALVGDSAWPRLVSALAVAAATLAWVATAPRGELVTGPWASLIGASLLLVAAAVASGPGVAEAPRPTDEPVLTPPW